LIGRHVAEMLRHIAVRRFVQGDGEQNGNGRDGNGLNKLFYLHLLIIMLYSIIKLKH
jgi:hypothetical protein